MSKLEKAIGVLAMLQRYFVNLPAPEPLLRTLSNAQRVQLCCALDIAQGDNLIEEFGELFAILRAALPPTWPVHQLAFVADFCACARGKAPMRRAFANGELEEVPVTAVTVH